MDIDPSLNLPADARLRAVGEATAAVFELAGALRRLWVEHASAVGLPVGEAKVLLTMRVGESTRMSVVAGRLGLDASNVTGLVDKLIARGAVERVTNAPDRRVRSVRITAEGLRIRDEFWHRVTHDSGPLGRAADRDLRTLRDLKVGILE